MRLANRFSAATAAASNSPLQGQSKPPAEPVVMIGANDVCLRQMMLASPMMLAYANDVLLRKMIGKHRIIASNTINIIMNEVNNIIF